MKKLTLFVTLAILTAGCSMHRKISSLRESSISADISLPSDQFIPSMSKGLEPEKDTIEPEHPVEVLIMNAVKDENGEMVATDVIRAAKVTARFRNVAERHGKVDLRFQVTVPESLQDGKWQLRLYPDMFIMSDSTRLEPVIITGAMYRKRQLRGYEQYQKFLDSIISDNGQFLNMHLLEVFLKRNIPQIYRFRNDSSLVSDEVFASVYGVTEQAAVEHYTNRFLYNLNERRKARKGKMYRKYIKAPIVKEGIRLDTVIVSPDGDFIYDYVQTINTCPGLKKADIKLSGTIYEAENPIFQIPRSKPLTFYISSLSSFADNSEKYMTKVISRRAEANTVCYVDFGSGQTDIDMNLGNNGNEIRRIKKNLADLAGDQVFDIDSIIVTASCSPEGTVSFNSRLSKMRAASISDYFRSYLKHCQDSIRNERGIMMSWDSDSHTEKIMKREGNDVKFISRSAGENWSILDALVRKDSLLNTAEKDAYFTIRKESDEDRREKALSEKSFYRHLREKVYPKLRTVQFGFFLHRKGMILDTVKTTVLDTAYMRGVQAIIDRDYKTAISILRPYQDYNLAVAYCAMDYNASAKVILERLKKTDRVLYMLAILHSRSGDYRKAAELYEEACSMNPSLVHRGNLDPEISELIKRFHLNEETE